MSSFMRLKFHRGPWAGREIVTSVPMLRIGTDPSKNDLVLDDPEMADAHCLLQRSARGEYILEDLSQLSGSMVINGLMPVDADNAIYLAPGDRFHVGLTEIELLEANPRLIQTAGPDAGREVPLGEQLVSFGRAPDNAIELSDSETSIYHAVVRVTAAGFSLEDQRSTNGSFVNGARVNSAMLGDGDLVRFGQCEFLFVAAHAAPDFSEEVLPGARRVDEIKAYLLVLTGPQAKEHIEIGAYPIVLGSGLDSDFVLAEADSAPSQCRILVSDDLHYIEDLGSVFRTMINGKPLVGQPHLLSPGDLIAIGSTVAEFRIVGGAVSESGVSMMMTSVIAAGAYDLTPQAKFVVNGHVEVCSEVVIGSSPSSHIQLDGEGINALHCRIVWAGSFFLEDTSSYGTYLGEKRVVREALRGSQVIRVGRELIDVAIHGERCNVDLIDRSTAAAAIEVAHEQVFDLRQAQLDPANMGGQFGSAYKTVYKLDYADVESLVRERKEKFRDGAPAWRPSTDIDRGSTARIAVVVTIAASLAIAYFAYQRGDAANALVNHPLSESHASVAFAQQAKSLGVPGDCRACHGAGTGVTAAQCTTCHEGFDESIRSEHLLIDSSKPTQKSLPGSQCTVCHQEHQATPRFVLGQPSVLGASRHCTSSGCHQNQHKDDFDKAPVNGPNLIQAGPIPNFDTPLEEFHVAHAAIEREGEIISIACSTCHSSEDESGALVERDAGRSCFGCHSSGSSASIATQCLSCHGLEHGTAHGFVRLPESSPQIAGAIRAPAPGQSLLWAALVMLAIFVPLVAFGMLLRVRAKSSANKVVAKLNAFPIQAIKHLVHSINLDKCVGCHACVQACPTSVLELVNHKSQIVNFDACIQCQACEKSCAFGALVMHDADKPPPTTKMPDLDNGFQTPIEGLYLIGQAAGIPQVKNGSNMGRVVVEKAAQMGMRPGEAARVGAQVDVLIIGSGPAGLSAALSCKKLGIKTLILEKQAAFAWTIRNYFHKGKEVMADPYDIQNAGLLPMWDTNREELLEAWQQVITDNDLDIRYRQKVSDVRKDGAFFEVTVADSEDQPVGTWTAARVIIAIGGLGTPRKLGCPGDELDKVRSALVDPDEFQGKEVLVVGGTDSAIEVALALSHTNVVRLSCRTEHFERAKPKNRERINEAFQLGKVLPHFSTAVTSVSETNVVLEDRRDGTTTPFANDLVFALIGGISPNKWLESIGITFVSRPHTWSPPPSDQMFRPGGQ